jgi:hypothetical protein
MNIPIKAELYVPGLLIPYGDKTIHPPIFKKEFSLDLTPEMLFDFLGDRKLILGKVTLFFKKRKKKRAYLNFFGELSSVSVAFFEELKADGWKLDETTAKQHNFPCDKTDRRMQEYIVEAKETTKRILRLTSPETHGLTGDETELFENMNRSDSY